MNPPTDDTLAAMDRYGGSFVRTLATLYRRADPENRTILDRAFAKIFATYANLAADERTQSHG